MRTMAATLSMRLRTSSTTHSTRRSGTPAAPTRSRTGGSLGRPDRPAAATLDYSPTGGGVISFLHNEPIRRRRTRPSSRAATRSPTASSSRMPPAAAAMTSCSATLGQQCAHRAMPATTRLAGRATADRRVSVAARAPTRHLRRWTTARWTRRSAKLAYDIITDFDGTSDKIDLSDLDAKLSTAANDAFTWIGTNANKNAGDLSVQDVRQHQRRRERAWDRDRRQRRRQRRQRAR